MPPDVAERFWKKVSKSDGCWEWTASLDGHGYGQFKRNGTMQRAYRVSYELSKGEIPNGMVLDHLCRNPKCVRPDHLEPVTQKENILRGTSKQAENARKTHCINGHEFSSENTYIRNSNGHRQCRKCNAVRETTYRKRRKAP